MTIYFIENPFFAIRNEENEKKENIEKGKEKIIY